MRLYGLDRDRRLRSDRTDQFQMVRRECPERIEPVRVQYTVDIRLCDQRSTYRRPYALRNDGIGTAELRIGLGVLRQDRDLIAHYLLRNRAADRQRLGQLFDTCIAGLDSDRIEAVIEYLAVERLVSDQGYDTIGRRTTKDQVGRFVKDLFQVKNRANRPAHLVQKLEHFGFAAQIFYFFRRCDSRFHREMRLTPDYLVRGYLDLRVPERLVVIINTCRSVRVGGSQMTSADVISGSPGLDHRRHFRLFKFEVALADQDLVAFSQNLFQQRSAVDEDVVNASYERSVLKITVD